MIFVTWKPPLFSFLKVNFNSSMLDGSHRGKVGFVIRDLDSRFIVAEVGQIYDSIRRIEMRAALGGGD